MTTCSSLATQYSGVNSVRPDTNCNNENKKQNETTDMGTFVWSVERHNNQPAEHQTYTAKIVNEQALENRNWTCQHSRFSSLRHRPHYPERIWKFSFISMARPTVHTNPSRKRGFWKTLSESEDLKTLAFHFRVDEKHFENGALRKRWLQHNHAISLVEVFPKNTKPK